LGVEVQRYHSSSTWQFSFEEHNFPDYVSAHDLYITLQHLNKDLGEDVTCIGGSRMDGCKCHRQQEKATAQSHFGDLRGEARDRSELESFEVEG